MKNRKEKARKEDGRRRIMKPTEKTIEWTEKEKDETGGKIIDEGEEEVFS